MGIIGVEGTVVLEAVDEVDGAVAVDAIDCVDVEDVAVAVVEGDATAMFDTAGVDCCDVHSPLTSARAKSFLVQDSHQFRSSLNRESLPHSST